MKMKKLSRSLGLSKSWKYILIGIILAISLPLASCTLTLPFSQQTTTLTTILTTTSPTPTWTVPSTTPAAVIGTQTLSGLPDLAALVAKVKPSVVAINVEIASSDFFGNQYTSEAAGSGWILDSNGLIATNNHVIDGATSISVTFDDGSVTAATVVGADAVSDLAVLKVDKTGLPAVTVGDSSGLQVGQWVLAIGNAEGNGISATEGIVSRTGASITEDTGTTLYDLIQTSAAINPGNSGGPLVNLSGEVVGITSAKLVDTGVEGMGYAISTKTALPIIESLVQKGYVIRPYLGVIYETISQMDMWRYRLPVETGAFVTQVYSGTPAETAGLAPGDIIVNFNGKDIQTQDDLTQAIFQAQIGQSVSITYWHNNSEKTTQATLVQSPAPNTTS